MSTATRTVTAASATSATSLTRAMNPSIDDPAWPNQLEAFRPYLMRFARARINDFHLAEDLVQETLLAALAGRAAFNGRSSLRTWLTSILKYKVIDVYRRNAAESPLIPPTCAEEDETALTDQVLHEAAAAESRDGFTDPARQIERQQQAANLMSAVRNLPPQQRDAFVLVHMHGYSGAEAASRVGVSHANLWVILHRTRKHLQTQLQMVYPAYG
jgi:RNA polymerase sigma-70 factor, ECF subfamily